MNLTFTNNTLPTGEIKIPEEFSTPRLEKLKKCMDFYRANGYFDRQIIVDSDKTLHDGYCAYITAVLMGAETVDVLMVGEKKSKKEPANESKPEPVKLYCVKNVASFYKRGKVYETDAHGCMHMEGGVSSCTYSSTDDFFGVHPQLKGSLVPLVHRPAKVGEWVYISDPHITLDAYSAGDVVRVEEAPHEDGIYFRSASGKVNKNCRSNSRLCYAFSYEYLVLDGYRGDSE